MNKYLDMPENQKIDLLESTVLNNTPNEAGNLLRELKDMPFTAWHLGLACRFCGIDMVKALAENGACFNYGNVNKIPAVIRRRLRLFTEGRFYIMLLDSSEGFGRGCYFADNEIEFQRQIKTNTRVLPLLPSEERVEILEYFLDNAEKTDFPSQLFLFYAIMSGDMPCYEKCKERGIALSEKAVRDITDSKSNNGTYNELRSIWSHETEKEFLCSARLIEKELNGGLFKFDESFFNVNESKFTDPECFEFLISHFNKKQMNQKKILRFLINSEAVGCLSIAEQYGWLKQPKKRDELIEYASDNRKTESTAWLLEFKNRTADLEAERIKAEKKIEHELNADPNSLTELKKAWRYEKLKDGTLMITSYRARRATAIVPSEIGGDRVTKIGECAFSPEAKRIHEDGRKFRECELQRVVLPEGITTICDGAFLTCRALMRITLPNTLKEIGATAFSNCNALTEVKFPEKLKQIGFSAFPGCVSLTEFTVPSKIKEIPRLMLANCNGLTELVIPSNIKKIECEVFLNCKGLKSIVISEGVEEIEKYAFRGCSALESVTLPKSLKKLENNPMRGKGTVCAFADCSENLVITVPAGSYAAQYCKRNKLKFTFVFPQQDGENANYKAHSLQ